MASARYTLNITPDPPEEPPHEMTAKEKRANFWFYYKWHVLVGLFVVIVAALLLKDVLFRTEPDYTVGVLSETGLPTGAAEALAEKFAEFFDDRNGDGKVVVAVEDYALPLDEDGVDPYSVMAATTRLTGDIAARTSVLFLTDNAPAYAAKVGVFVTEDGDVVEEGETADEEALGPLWSECPALAGIGEAEDMMGSTFKVDELMADFRILRRVFPDEAMEKKDDAANYSGSMAAYEAMTAR